MSGDPPAKAAERWAAIARLFEDLADAPADVQAERLAREEPRDPDAVAAVRRMLAADRAAGDLVGGGLGAVANLALAGPALQSGARVGAFDIVGELGRGGMGIVYAARDRHLDRPAALKFLPARSSAGAAAADRLLAEAKAASALDHPNVATVYQVGETDDGERFIAMARYEGETLRARLERGPLAAAEALGIARQVAAGLAAAHRAGIVHRDVTPANIFLTHDGTAKLLDFGIAVLAGAEDAPGTARGTVSAMSPEQARGEAADPRTDVWALGMALYRMVTGEVPFAGETTAAVLARVRGPEPAPSLRGRREVPRPMAAVIDRALQKDPRRRFPDAEAMLAALDAAAAPRRTGRRAAAAMLGVVTLAGAGAIALRPPAPATPVPAAPVLAVAPVDAGSADSATAALAAALVDDVGRRLTILGRVRVVPSDSGAGGAGDATHRLDVGLRGPGAGQTLAAAIRQAGSADTVWSASMRFDAGELRELSRELAESVLRSLGVTLTAREQAVLAAGFPSSIAAYEELLAGNQLLRTRTPEDLLAAIGHYRAAHARDSTFVSALARHAYAIALLLDWGWRHPTATRDDLLREGLALSGRALALDSASAEAWLARAYLMAASDPARMRGAPDAFRRAIALDPYNGEAYHQYGQTAMQLGMFAEAATAYRRAIELEPGSAMSLISLGGLEELEGRRGRAMRYFDSAVAVAPDMPYARAIRALVRSYEGDYAGARDDAAAALAADTTFLVPGLATMAIAVHGLGDSAAAVEWLRRAERAVHEPGAPTADEAQLLANAQLALGRHEEAVATVVRARPRAAPLWYLFQHPRLDTLRADPRVAEVLYEADPRGG